jgi:serine protease inhibitor
LTALEKAQVESSNQFGIKLFQKMVEIEPDTNLFISPLSVSLALGMTYNGAATTTEQAMRQTLEYGNLSNDEINEAYKNLMAMLLQLDPEVIFEIANSIWYRQNFEVLQSFIDVNKTYFDAEVNALDFNSPDAVAIINGWVKEKTHDKIEEIIDQIDPLAVMFLINAIYFKGTWTYQFDPELTTDDQFRLSDGTMVPCKMMNQENNFQYLNNETFQAIDLPYGNKQFSMAIILPHYGQSLDSIIAEITPEKWNQWMGAFSEKQLSLQMPKFTLEYELKLNDVLTAMGMGIAFSDAADFSGINPYYDLYISQVKHKTYIKVDEEGTEAAAVTVVEVGYTSIGPTMRVDRPFLCVIQEKKSGTILFIGKIAHPRIGE